jgi:hypothetical protein
VDAMNPAELQMAEESLHRDIAGAFELRGPWVTGFEIEGRVYGNSGFVPDGAMEREARDCFPAARRVLELGTLEGGRTRHLAAWARHVISLDARPENLARAAWIKDLYVLDNVELLQADLEYGLPATPPVDLIYCVGVLYHMPRPWALIEAMAARCPNLYLWTHVAGDDEETILVGSAMRFKRYREHGRSDVLSGMSGESLWPTRATLLAMLGAAGYVAEVLDDTPHQHGPAVTLACRQKG